jgi:hypothetical protein
MEPVEIIWRLRPQEIWVFVLLIFGAILYLVNRSLNPGLHRARLLAAVLPALPNRFEESDLGRPAIQDLLAFVFSNLMLALPAFFLLPVSGIFSAPPDFRLYVVLVLLLAGLYFSKYCLYYLFADSMEFNTRSFLFIQQLLWLQYLSAGITALLMMVWYYQYDPNIRWYAELTLVAVLGFSVLYRVIKLFLYMFSFRSFSALYIILYLCALELMPLLLTVWYVGKIIT